MKKTISFLLVCLFCAGLFCAAAQAAPPRVIDEAMLLSAAEEGDLAARIAEIGARYKFDIVLLTNKSLDGKSPMAFADDCYDQNGYGYGAGSDGVLLLLSMSTRDWWLSTCGYGIKVFTDYGIDRVEDLIVSPYFGEDEFYEGFAAFLDLCEDYLEAAESGKPYDTGNRYKEQKSYLLPIGIALCIALLFAFLITRAMKAQLKTAVKKAAASDYLKAGSFALRDKSDLFLYSRITHVPIPRNTGGSSTHRSSSGISHGGGGGKF